MTSSILTQAPSTGRKRSRSESEGESDGDNKPTKTANEDGERPAKRSCIEEMFNLNCVQSESPSTQPQCYNPASNNVLGAEKLLNDDPESEQKKMENKSRYFRSSGLQCNPQVTTAAAVNQNATSSTTPSVSVPQNDAGAAVRPRKQKYSFGRTNNLNEEEEL